MFHWSQYVKMLTTQVAIELVKCLPWLREGKMVPLLAGGGGEGGMGMGMGGLEVI